MTNIVTTHRKMAIRCVRCKPQKTNGHLTASSQTLCECTVARLCPTASQSRAPCAIAFISLSPKLFHLHSIFCSFLVTGVKASDIEDGAGLFQLVSNPTAQATEMFDALQTIGGSTTNSQVGLSTTAGSTKSKVAYAATITQLHS